MVLISDGLSLAPGEASFRVLEACFPECRSTLALENVRNIAEPIYKLAVQGNVPIYTIDSLGLSNSQGLLASRGMNISVASQVSRALDDREASERLTLSEMAAATGGTAFQNNNDLFAGLKRAFADGREYYMLAYVPTNAVQDGKFRKIEVSVRDHKDVVNAKRGYWATAR